MEVSLTDELLDRIDEIVPPGTDIGPNGAAYVPPEIEDSGLRRRPMPEQRAVVS